MVNNETQQAKESLVEEEHLEDAMELLKELHLQASFSSHMCTSFFWGA